MTDTHPIPVTLLTGFLGAGKTTLLNRILQEPHGQRIAVIENEFGETGIDNELLFQAGEQIVEMNNGCICCTVRGDLLRILGDLAGRREAGEIRFDRVVIETTGLADPAPVAQTFFVEETIRDDYRLDAILTVVDAKHAPRQLDEHHEAQEQVGFADRILLSKTDLVDAAALAELEARLRAMNPRAPIQPVHFGQAPLRDILDIHGFDLDAILGIEPDFLNDLGHEHDDEVHAFVYRAERPFDAAKLLALMDLLISEFGVDLLRYKGILHIAGNPNKIVFQGVHGLLDESLGAPWREDEKRESVLVFIGRNLPREQIVATLKTCHAHG
ncbi:GTPase, G3E family [Methylomagnum ishizawai]|uniref:GTPase, G3E family n=1 Tax=Methylomagnum ishizawai TaxID=1760988 RepID=A0A1Y6CY88_9GAMM|nr:GTP-binding protein [Methylomagnum ishizawai]SMF93533.1 GTPase, G3E family [Methylomagnum ishizawai]